MIDGIKVACRGLSPSVWRSVPVLDFSRPVSENTGEIQGKCSEAKRYGITFRISDTLHGGFCRFSGSIHRHKNKGGENDDIFTFSQVTAELEQLRTLYSVPLETAEIRGLEVGINIFTKYPPRVVLRQVISHRRKPFVPMSRKNKMLGKLAERTDYAVKIYDKLRGGKTSNGEYILRVEVRYERMRIPIEKCGVRVLADLQDFEKLEKLAALLVATCEDIIFYDHKARPVGLTSKQATKWAEFGNPYFWDSENLTRKDYYKQRKAMEKLRIKGGVSDPLAPFINSVKKAVQETRQIKLKKGGRFPQKTEESKAPKKGTFSTLEYMLPNVAQTCNELGDVSKRKKSVEKSATKRRFCRTCGKEITDQAKGSVFCSERLYGKEAKRCRNKESNDRARKRKTIKQAIKQKMYILITYEKDGATESVQLAPHELYLSREWLDTVKQIKTSDEFTATGKRAQLVLWQSQERAKINPTRQAYKVPIPHEVAESVRRYQRFFCSVADWFAGSGVDFAACFRSQMRPHERGNNGAGVLLQRKRENSSTYIAPKMENLPLK